MSWRRLLSLAAVPFVLVVLLVAVGAFPGSRADALPPAGLDVLNVTAQVDATSRLGQEVITLNGTASIQRADPHMEDGVEVADMELVGLDLHGASLIGDVVVAESQTLFSPGELRSQQAGQQFPADVFIDAFINVTVPANPTPTLLLHNNQAFHLVPRSGNATVPVNAWPPSGVTFALEPIYNFDNDGDTLIDEDTADEDGDGLIDEDRPGPDPDSPGNECPNDPDCDHQEGEDPPAELCPAATNFPTLCDPDGDGQIDEDPACIPMLNVANTHLKYGVCIRNISITLGDAKTPTPTAPPQAYTTQTLSVAPLGPSGFHPAAVMELIGEQGQVSGNDNFSNAWPITALPFVATQSTAGMTEETGEPMTKPACIVAGPNTKGSTVWFRYNPPAPDNITVSTNGSDFDTVIAMYTGGAVNALTQIACDDDGGTGLQSEFTAAVSPGVNYYIQAGGFALSQGNLALSVSSAGGAGDAPPVRLTCSALGLTADGCDDGADGDQDDIDAMSFGGDFPADDDGAAVAFSVAPGSIGLAASAVAQQTGCTPPQAVADEFKSDLGGSNVLAYDGDGAGPNCPTADNVGLIELPESDDIDALVAEPPSVVDPDGNGVLDERVFFSLGLGSPTLVSSGRNGADILMTTGGAPSVYASNALLGLTFGDDVDALCVVDRGVAGTYEAGLDTILFSLAAGSPALADFGLSAAAILRPGPQQVYGPASLGLRSADDLDALKCFASESGPTPTPTLTPVPTFDVGDANCDGNVNAIDSAVVLQLSAGLLTGLPCQDFADVNDDGHVDALDAALILQYVAGLIPHLPP